MRFPLLAALALLLSSLCSAQPGTTKLFNFPAGGEQCLSVTPYKGGFLLASAFFGNQNGQLEYSLRMVDTNDNVLRSIRLPNDFRHNFHPVVTTDGNIFVFGHATLANSTEVNYVILDSTFTVLHEKKLVVPYPIIFCKFFKAKDGGVIGSVHEVCDESRFFRIDADGDLLWVKSYVARSGSSGLYNKTVLTSIHLFGGDKYLVTGYLGFGYGAFFLKIDDTGEIISSRIIELFPTGYNSDVMWKAAFDGVNLITTVDNATNGQDSTFLIVVDTLLNILHCKRVIHSDTIAQPRRLIATPAEFVLVYAIDTDPPFATTRVAITGLDKNTLAPTWTIETRCDTVQDATFYFFDGGADGNGDLAFLYNYGSLNWQTSSGNFNSWGLTRLDATTHAGFCDGQNATTSIVPAVYTFAPYYIDTMPHPFCYSTNATHLTSTVPLGTSTILCAVGIEEVTATVGLNAYPNPTSGIITLDNFYEVTVHDISGKVVMTSARANAVDLSGEPAGVYFITLANARGETVQRGRIIKQ